MTDVAVVENPRVVEESPRVCGSCTKCCEGWLHGKAYDKSFWRGRPCHYLIAGKCSIYGNHPEDPCKSFRCAWLKDTNIPGWMKPDNVNAILVWRRRDDMDYLELNEAGGKLQVEVLSWAVIFCLQNGYNLKYTVDGGPVWVGSQDFLKLNWS